MSRQRLPVSIFHGQSRGIRTSGSKTRSLVMHISNSPNDKPVNNLRRVLHYIHFPKFNTSRDPRSANIRRSPANTALVGPFRRATLPYSHTSFERSTSMFEPMCLAVRRAGMIAAMAGLMFYTAIAQAKPAESDRRRNWPNRLRRSQPPARQRRARSQPRHVRKPVRHRRRRCRRRGRNTDELQQRRQRRSDAHGRRTTCRRPPNHRPRRQSRERSPRPRVREDA